MPSVDYKTKKSPRLDMNPMVDLAFLLVTFFMLTTTFKANNPFEIQNPYSVSDIKLPEQNLLIISVDEAGNVYLDFDGKTSRERLVRFMVSEFKIPLNDEQVAQFGLLNSVGVPMDALPQFLSLPAAERNQLKQAGIPVDSAQNELQHWVVYARTVNPLTRVAINADEDTPFEAVDRVIKTLTRNKVHRFNLVTDKELSGL